MKQFIKSLLIVCLFGACSKDADPPTVITGTMSNIDAQTAWCSGEAISDGGSKILQKGVCWSTEHDPTINDRSTNEGEGTGKFNSKLTGLQNNEYYYVRAYATNKSQTGYGIEIGFKAERNSQFPIVEFNGKFIYVFPKDVSPLPIAWGAYGQNIGAKSTTNGVENTTKIVNALSNFEEAAAKYCDELDEYGYDDWYLPASGELKEIYKHKDEVGNFHSDGYWCSTEYTPYNAYYVSFLNGKLSQTIKSYKYYLRCVRKDP